jgi:hypothetical protein
MAMAEASSFFPSRLSDAVNVAAWQIESSIAYTAERTGFVACCRPSYVERSPHARRGYETIVRDNMNEWAEVPGFEAVDFSDMRRPAAETIRKTGRTKTETEFAELIASLGLKYCPQCGNACMKEDEDSCDHMTCVCGKEFCWSCLADRVSIQHHGNHYHRPECRFYVAYSGPDAEQFEDNCPRCNENPGSMPCAPPDAMRSTKKKNTHPACGGQHGRCSAAVVGLGDLDGKCARNTNVVSAARSRFVLS